MPKSFDIVWEEAEELIHSIPEFTLLDAVKNLREGTDTFINKTLTGKSELEAMGEALLALCYLSRQHNINVYEALIVAMEAKKIDSFG